MILKQFEHQTWITPGTFDLAENTAHLWRIPMDPDCRLHTPLAAVDISDAHLTPTENDRTAFLATRAAMRTVLARYFQTEPHWIQFEKDRRGNFVKAGRRILRISSARTDELAVFILSNDAVTAIALEKIHADLPFCDLAETFLDSPETWNVRTARGRTRARRFFEHWTGGEARKALPDAQAVYLFRPRPGYQAAMAADRHDIAVKLCHFKIVPSDQQARAA